MDENRICRIADMRVCTRGYSPCRLNLDFIEGMTFDRGNLKVTVTKTKKHRIREIEVSLHEPLDSPNIWLLAWEQDRFVRCRPPPVGERMQLTDAKGCEPMAARP